MEQKENRKREQMILVGMWNAPEENGKYTKQSNKACTKI